MGTRTRKVLRDLLQERGRALLTLAALVVGGWGVGSVIASTTVLRREVRDNFRATSPAHATLTLRGEGDAAAAAVAASWVTQAELRTSLDARAEGGFDGRLPVVLILVEDFERQELATVALEEGRWPAPGEVALERDDLTVLGLDEPPETLRLQLPGAEWRDVAVSGVVHDPGQAPARMEHRLYVYAPPATARALGADLARRDLIVRMAPPAVTSRRLALAHAQLLGERLGEQGFEVLDVRAPEPDTHPHEGQMRTALFLQVVFGGLAMLLAGLVVIHLVASLMQRQVAQIGVLKAVGATPAQVGGTYLLHVLALAAVALAIDLPLGFASGLRYARAFTAELNFDVLTPSVPLGGWLLFAGLMLGLPLLAAAVPVLRGVRVPVREALDADGATAAGALATRRRLPIALRNVARRPGRAALAALALAVGLAGLGAAFHVGASMRATMEYATRNRPYDLAVAFDESVDEEAVARVMAGFEPRVRAWRGRRGRSAARVGPDGRAGEPFAVLEADALEPQSAVVAGRWRLPPEGRAVLVNTRFAEAEGLAVGDVLTLRIDGVDARWPVEAIVRQIGGGAVYLLSREPLGFEGLSGVTATLAPPSAEDLRRAAEAPIAIGHGRHGSRAPALTRAFAKYQAGVVAEVERAFEDAQIPVRAASTKAELVAGLEDHIHVMTKEVALGALVLIAVAALGLASAMSVSVLERTREIGVLRALGATPCRLARVFAAEGAVVGAAALVAGLLASYPLGRAIADWFGDVMFATPLDRGTSLAGAAWGAGVTAVLVAAVTAAALVQTLRQPTTAALRHE